LKKKKKEEEEEEEEEEEKEEKKEKKGGKKIGFLRLRLPSPSLPPSLPSFNVVVVSGDRLG